jgi:hypothetical protein
VWKALSLLSLLIGCSGQGQIDKDSSQLWCVGACKLIITDENVTVKGEVEREEIKSDSTVD